MSEQARNTPSGSWNMILLLIIVGAAALMLSRVSADTGVTITALGDQSYYLGEKVVFSGNNYDSDTTYLFINGPATFMNGPGIPSSGGNLTSPLQAVVSGNPDSFTVVKTKPDKTWDYGYYTANLPADAGTYTVYAVSQPKAKDQLTACVDNVGIILKKPFITAEISSATISKGVPFTVSGFAEGNPETVQIWIIGDNYVFNATTPVNPDTSFTFTGDTLLSGKLPKGPYYLIVQHSMQNNTFDIVASGDYIRNLQGDNGKILFKIHGAGSLQGGDAADALIAALGDPQNGDDTYTVIPFRVVDAGSPTPEATAASTVPIQPTTQHALLRYALFGAIVVAAGIVMWKRH